MIQGSPQLNLLVNNTDVYIDNKLAFTNFFYPFAAPNPATSGPVIVGPVTPYIELPIGQHDFRLVQHGTTAPTFLEKILTLAANNKYAIVIEGDAGQPSSTSMGLFIEAKYNTASTGGAVSFFNASPRAGTVDAWFNCEPCNNPEFVVQPVGCVGAACTSYTTVSNIGTGVIVGTSAAPPASWKTNVNLFAGQDYCFGANVHPVLPPPPAEVNTPPGALIAAFPANSNPSSFTNCFGSNQSVPAVGGPYNANLYLIDGPLVAPSLTSSMLLIPDSNG